MKQRLINFLYNFLRKNTQGNFFAWLKILDVRILLFLEKTNSLSHLSPRPSFLSWLAFSLGSHANKNSLGNIYAVPKKEWGLSHQIEAKVIEWNKQLVHCTDPKVEGYVTSGGTEANLFLMWLGREQFLKKSHSSKPIVLLSSFAHYSLSKSARILDLKIHEVAVSEESWAINVASLKKVIEMNVHAGHNHFLLPLTIGYSSLGTSDPIQKILGELAVLKKHYRQLEVFVWIDGAMGGLATSFLQQKFSPFQNSFVQGYLVDFHKFGKAPLPTGVVLYRKQLRKQIQKEVAYLQEKDATLLGSRPFAAVLGIWANIIAWDVKRWTYHFRALMKKGKLLQQTLSQEFSLLKETNLPVFALIKKHPGQKTSYTQQNLMKIKIPYLNSAGKRKVLTHYKVYVTE